MTCDICGQSANGRYFGSSSTVWDWELNPRSGAIYWWGVPVVHCRICSTILAAQGLDWEDVIEQYKREKEILGEAGLPTDLFQ